jgi:hypothetical protein
MKKNQKGMLGVEGVLFLIIIGLIAFIGWYTWHTKQQTNASLNASASKQIAVKAKDPTADWVKFSSTAGKFSLKYPKEWYLPVNKQLCPADMLMLGGSQDTAGHCASGDVGEVIITSLDGDKTKDYQLNKTDYPDLTLSKVTLNGIQGQKITGTFHQTTSAQSPAVAGLADNTTVVVYAFVTGGKTYVAAYYQKPGAPDISKDFGILVGRTLKFSI